MLLQLTKLHHVDGWIITLWMYLFNIFFMSLSARYLNCFHFLAWANSAAINVGMQVFLWQMYLVSLEYLPWNVIAGSYCFVLVWLVCLFLRNIHALFHSGCTKLHFQQQSASVLPFLDLCQHWLSLPFFPLQIGSFIPQILLLDILEGVSGEPS